MTRPRTTPQLAPLRLAKTHLKPTDLRAIAQLATQATLGLVDVTEGVHHSVLRSLGARRHPGGRTAGLTGLVYRGVRGITGLVGQGLDGALATVVPWLSNPDAANTDSAERTQVLAALNGVLGDRLQAQHSSLALDMGFRINGQPWQPGQPLAPGNAPTPHVLLTIHGLCMTDGQWCRQGHDHGAWLADALGCTRLNLRYNTGLHISDNGAQLADCLERLVTSWPVPLTRLSLLTHSMGGLVARSAHAAGTRAGHTWPQRLKDLVFLGTPHHGSPLERAGHGVDLLLGASRFTAPFVRLGQVRSAGITDLRHGHVLPDDWQAQTRLPRALGRMSDTRVPLPLPDGVNCYAVAATLAGQRSLLADRLTGDGLVPLNSALGAHDDPRHHLRLPRGHQRVVYRTGHLALLSSATVAQQLLAWLSSDTGPATAPP